MPTPVMPTIARAGTQRKWLRVDAVTPTGGCASSCPLQAVVQRRWREENPMIGNRSPETLSGQAAPPKLEQVQQTQEAQAKAGPQPVQHPKPGRKPLFRR